MIWTLIFVAVLILSIPFYIWADRTWIKHRGVGWEVTSALCVCISAIALIVSVIMIVISHSGVELQIEKNNMKRDAIIQQIESLDAENEDISRITVISKVAEWNRDVKSDRYWANNPWTNWFYSQEVVDSLEYIDWEGQHVPES